MKKLLVLLFIINSLITIAQTTIDLMQSPGAIGFEFPGDTQYVQIDTNRIWFIAPLKKERIILPSGSGENAIMTDTSQFYPPDGYASFQFKLAIGFFDYRTILFWMGYDFEQNKDGGTIETSYDDGETWNNLIFDTAIMNHTIPAEVFLYDEFDTIAALGNRPGFTGSDYYSGFDVTWSNRIMPNDTMLLRFTFASDSVDTPFEGWVLDDFNFIGDYVSIESNTNQLSVFIFPNPTIDLINIFSKAKPIIRVEVLSLVGRLLLVESGFDIKSLSVDSLQPGYYIVRCIGQSGMTSYLKFLKI
jgi:hypothetical protein